jgi:hypothetical protein
VIRRRFATSVVVAVLVVTCSGALRAGAGSRAPRAVIQTAPFTPIVAWTPQSDNRKRLIGRVLLNGAPVAGVRLRVDGYLLPATSSSAGQFTYRVDGTVIGRYPITVADASRASVEGRPLTSAESSALAAASGAATIAYPVVGVETTRLGGGDSVVTGHLAANGAGLPIVGLYSYRLSGTVLDANGHPVAGAQVSTRTRDRDYWTRSPPTDPAGHFDSLFTASSETGENPVGMTLRVALGNRIYSFLPDEYVWFKRLQSATMTIRLPPAGYAFVLPLAHSYQGAIYRGVLVGGAINGRPIKPVSVTWPSANGSFRIVLAPRYAGKKITLWEGSLDLFSTTPGRAGGPVDLQDWPKSLGPSVPHDLADVRLP